MSSLEINVTRVPEGIRHYSFVAHARDLGLIASIPSDVAVEADLERRGRQFLVTGEVQATGRFTCDRCLTEFDQSVDTSFRVLFMPDGVPGTPTEADEEVRHLPADSQVIVLDEDVRQSIALAVPVKLLCREDCEGLCPQCGRNLNDGQCSCKRDDTDPRWEPLRKLSRS
jgi:uncharacterized protein